jgi:GNAT superfamily N-acetyltransferase/acyl carrier protein
MNRDDAVRMVEDTIQDRVFDGEKRELPLNATLAEVGFDSLAVVVVLSGLEASVGSGFPDGYWEERGTLRVRDLVDAVERLSASSDAHPAAPLELAVADNGGHPAAVLRSVATGVSRRVFSAEDFVLIEHGLAGDLPNVTPPSGVVLRKATVDDAAQLATLWPLPLRPRALRQIRSWLGEGYLALGAFEGERAMALDWLHHSDPAGAVVGIDGTCVGIDLRERSGQVGRGIGFALLAHSLRVARAEGYARQAAAVAHDNVRMRTACTSLLGFTEVGSARRTTRLGRVQWTWTRNGAAGSGTLLPL